MTLILTLLKEPSPRSFNHQFLHFSISAFNSFLFWLPFTKICNINGHTQRDLCTNSDIFHESKHDNFLAIVHFLLTVFRYF